MTPRSSCCGPRSIASELHQGPQLRFGVLLLLGQRPGEVAGMAIDELHDLDDPSAALWSIPAHRMKGRRPHLVPLPPLACSIIRGELARREDAEFVFASRFLDRDRLARHTLIEFARPSDQ